ncbi:hypothetical protein PF005_g3147 [Phytophthora fragariae]|uniref:Uncharacterized protein n=2 Tax=Phytophthora TaxID=4783 RepID=A0A6A3FMI6_9STRA|nr:hypothetical protein PF003_g28229 [Phytophthora fragariae]KAE9047916.1 hypothetical protein PR002_g787 [Phytophthora rubi]KAE8946969.1 hypothetical protein PF009_g3428 [Phytophthora fragariae]KAE9022705.1 hypothetical protein PF011_g4339 [Phytophthora fragariae]KAE9052315.1 hypothetical protein PR001_g648 [Phytophthora rubi]
MEPRRREKKAAHGDRKDGVMPVSLKLQTELLAERRLQQREEREVAQLRHAQQKIMGRKTVEDFAQLKLLRRETAATKSRSLHCNGRQIDSAARCKRSERVGPKKRDPETKVCLESRPLQSAREANSRLVSRSLPQRPQSAKPVLQTHSRSSGTLETMAAGSVEEAALLDGRQTKAHVGKKKKKRKSIDRKPRRLESSSSTPVLTESSMNSPACKKISIVVNMRNLQLQGGKESPGNSNNSPPRAILAWGD